MLLYDTAKCSETQSIIALAGKCLHQKSDVSIMKKMFLHVVVVGVQFCNRKSKMPSFLLKEVY